MGPNFFDVFWINVPFTYMYSYILNWTCKFLVWQKSWGLQYQPIKQFDTLTKTLPGNGFSKCTWLLQWQNQRKAFHPDKRISRGEHWMLSRIQFTGLQSVFQSFASLHKITLKEERKYMRFQTFENITSKGPSNKKCHVYCASKCCWNNFIFVHFLFVSSLNKWNYKFT
jgi:hypothetical protein